MAISRGSALKREARSFTLAFEEYQENGMKCILFEGENKEGFCFDNFYKLMNQMETCFKRSQYPVPSVIKRSFVTAATACAHEPGDTTSVLREAPCGKQGTFRVWVRLCQHASWQGDLEWLDKKQYFRFGSFLDLILLLDSLLSGEEEMPEQLSATREVRLTRGLELMSKGGDKQREHRNIIDNMIFCKQTGAARQRATFTIYSLFGEHRSIQGSLNWNEGRRRLTFRSFLELIQLMESVDLWNGVREAVS